MWKMGFVVSKRGLSFINPETNKVRPR